MNSQSDNSTQTDEQFLDEVLSQYADVITEVGINAMIGNPEQPDLPNGMSLKAAILHHFADRLTVERRDAKISVLTGLAAKPNLKPGMDDYTPEYAKGFKAMQDKVKFELNRLKQQGGKQG